MSEDLFRVQEVPKKSLRVRKKKQEWVEANFVAPEINDDYTRQYGATDGFLGTVFTQQRLKLALSGFLVALVALLGRAMQLQIVQGAEYRQQSDQNRLRTEYIRSDRGLIYDRYRTPLVRNIPNYALTLQASALPNDEIKRAEFLQRLYTDYLLHYRKDTLAEFHSYAESLRRDPALADKPVVIADGIKQDHAISLQLLQDSAPALTVELLARREYLTEGPPIDEPGDTTVYAPVKSLSHVLGYLSTLREGEYASLKESGYLFNDVKGRTGLEAQYEQTLRGTFGKKSVEVNALGEVQQILAQQQTKDGLDLITSIDVEFQRAAEDILQRALVEYEKAKGSIVVMHPQNGEILAIVSLPTFENNEFAKGISSETYQMLIEDETNPLFFRSIAGEYPSGSTFKPIVAAAALQEGLVTPNTTYLSQGGIRINQWFFPDWRAGGHGLTNVYHALADSVNTYFYIIGGGYAEFDGLGVDVIASYARDFGLSEPLGIDLPAEAAGFLPSKEWKEATKNERWYIGDTYHLAIGQGDLLVTPLQVASFYATIANGGTVYRPRMVSAYADHTGNIVQKMEPEVLSSQVIAPAHLDVIQTGLRRVVTVGSGKWLADLTMPVSGKTGTAQWHSSKPPHAWFAGYAPTDHPQIAFSILVEEGEEGSGVTTRIAKDLLQWWQEHRLDISE